MMLYLVECEIDDGAVWYNRNHIVLAESKENAINLVREKYSFDQETTILINSVSRISMLEEKLIV